MVLPIPAMIRHAGGVCRDTRVRGVQSEYSSPQDWRSDTDNTLPQVLSGSWGVLAESVDAESIAWVSNSDLPVSGQLVHSVDSCIMGELNITPASAGLVTSSRKLGLCATWGDEPAWIAVYLDPDDSKVRVIATGSGVRDDLRDSAVQQTVAQIGKEVEGLGGIFAVQNLWVAISPGARPKGGLDRTNLVVELWRNQGLSLYGKKYLGGNQDLNGKLFVDWRPSAVIGGVNPRIAAPREVIAVCLA